MKLNDYANDQKYAWKKCKQEHRKDLQIKNSAMIDLIGLM